MKPLPILTALTLAGCNAPGVDFWGGTTSKQAAGGHSFSVTIVADRAEAYRTSPARRLSRAQVFESAARAMEQASGCTVPRDTLIGDVARIEAELIC